MQAPDRDGERRNDQSYEEEQRQQGEQANEDSHGPILSTARRPIGDRSNDEEAGGHQQLEEREQPVLRPPGPAFEHRELA